ncbi:MAG: putative ABC transporter permease [Solirubrobacterales bacterium]
MAESFIIYNFLYIFVIYSFIGWCMEVIYAAVTEGKFINRGFLNGPVCPIYGFGMIIIIILLSPIKENLLFLFTGSVILTTFLEGFTGLILEKLFHTKWWDYSNFPFNLGGYVCLAFSIAWGLGCVMIIKVIHPAVEILIIKSWSLAGGIFLAVALLVFAVDAASTVVSIFNLNERLRQLEEVGNKIREISEELGENISKTALAVVVENEKIKDKLQDRYPEFEELLHRQKKLIFGKYFTHKRLIKAFPDVKSSKFADTLEKLKQYL